MRAPTARQVEVLRFLDGIGEPETPARIAMAIGFSTSDTSNRAARNFSPAQRIIGSLNGLRRRGFVGFASRSDGLSGTAYRITEEGRKWLAEHR